jgi:hypothetical protein
MRYKAKAMRSLTAAALTVTALTFSGGLAVAQTTSEQAAKDATQAAQAVLLKLEQRHGSGMAGTVTLRPLGSRTEVLVSLRSIVREKPVVTLHRGSDCQDGQFATASDIALAPLNAAAGNAPMSRTIINLPIEKIRGNDYVVDVRNATQSAQFAQACARLRR